MPQLSGAALSARLAAAQEELQQRRCHRRHERRQQQLPILTDARGRLTSSPSVTDESPPFELNVPSDGSGAVGWESEPLTRALRRARQRQEAADERRHRTESEWLLQERQPAAPGLAAPVAPAAQAQQAPTVLLYPDLAIAMLRENLVATGRIWLLLRHLDVDGRGWIEVSTARERLTAKGSELRVCGWRQLRNLLAQGAGIFWEREDLPASEARLWLRSTAKVAAALNVRRLSTRAIFLDVALLLESIGTIRAHFYASYHSGRRKNSPISRQSLQAITGVSRRSQHSYEAKAGLQRRQNWAIGPQYSQEAAQDRAWQQGNAVFKFTDHQGRTGTAGTTYLAWQLPNSYIGPHEQQGTASRKRINRQLVDLFKKGITGNGKKRVEQQDVSHGDTFPAVRFYEHGQAAARAYNCSPQKDLYWQSHTTVQQYRVWHILPARESDS